MLKHRPLALWITIFCAYPYGVFSQPDSTVFICTELLGRPTDRSVTLNLCADREIEIFVEYGTQPASYTDRTVTYSLQKNVPCDLLIDRLEPNRTYSYRVRYRPLDAKIFNGRVEHSFQTAKRRGVGFTFCVEADPHLDYNTDPDLYRLTLANISKDQPDFLIDLGDSFMSDKVKQKTQDSILYRHLLLRSFFADICHSMPLYLVLGNHEGEYGYWLNGTENNLAVMASKTRLAYFPNPLPDLFYSANSIPEPFIGLRENYYAWEWGDALFVVLDPYWSTASRQGDNWRYTLGKEQYDWFRDELAKSDAAFKFVFCHQIIGGQDTQGRGGSDVAQYYEMGGLNADSTWGFSEHRPGWELPLHQLMAKYHVNIFFHGHDHFYARQEKDGIIYQLLPQPGFPGSSSINQAASFGYFTGQILPGSGYLRVAVADTIARVEFVRSLLPAMESQEKKNGIIEQAYTLQAHRTSTKIHNNPDASAPFALLQNYPNPFNFATTIFFRNDQAGLVAIDLFNRCGQKVKSILHKPLPAGQHSVSLDASALPTGLYFYRICSGKQIQIKKMIYQK